ncbi:MAG: hypothetical protein H5T83_05590 [Actinotalea sp.]|nr:hypothetical protein [Actinotalea sp.]
MDHHRDIPVTGTTNPGGGREENPPEVEPVTEPSHPANPLDGAPSPGPQPGSTVDPDHDPDRRGRHRVD